MTDDTRLERAIEELLFSKIASDRLVGYTVTVAHEIMGLIRNIGIHTPAQPSSMGREAVEAFIQSLNPIQQVYCLDDSVQASWQVRGLDFFTLNFTEGFNALGISTLPSTPLCTPSSGVGGCDEN